MSDHVELKTSRFAYLLAATLSLLASFGAGTMILFQTKQEIMENAASYKGGGILLLVVDTLGWEAAFALLIFFGLFGIWGAAACFWKGLFPFPNIRASAHLIEFHPAIKKSPVTYDQISRWTVKKDPRNWALILYLNEPYWSLWGVYPRKTIKINGSEEQLTPLIDYFMQHPMMREKSAIARSDSQ